MKTTFSVMIPGLLVLGLTVVFLTAPTESEPRGATDAIAKDVIVIESSNRRGMSYVGKGDSGEDTINPTIGADRGDTVTLRFNNSAGGVHNLVIPAFDARTDRLFGQERDTVTFVATRPGTFPYYCSVARHRQAGMEGTIVVEPDSSPKETPES